MRLGDKRDPAYWQAVKPDTSIVLTDPQALRESVSGEMYLVRSVTKIRHMEGLCEWIMLELEGMGDTPDSWLMVKIVDQAVQLRVFFENDQFESGDRKDLVDNEDLWVFQEPEEEDFEYEELKYALHVGWDFDGDEEGDPPIHVDYNVKTGEMQGRVTYDPHRSGQSEHVATIVEYDTSDETTCPEMLLLEIGNAENEQGGMIRMMFGNDIQPTEAEVLAVT